MADRNVHKHFGQRVRVALAAARIGRAEMARMCGVSPQAVQRWCDGTAIPGSAHLLVFCRETGCSVEWLMWSDEVDIKSTPYAPGGIHVKTLIRAVIEDMAHDGVLRVVPVDAT